MIRRLLLSGRKSTIQIIDFDANSSALRQVSTPSAPHSVNWMERSPVIEDVVYAASGMENTVYSLLIWQDGIEITSKRATNCERPVHCESLLVFDLALVIKLINEVAISPDASALITGGVRSAPRSRLAYSMLPGQSD